MIGKIINDFIIFILSASMINSTIILQNSLNHTIKFKLEF